MHKFAPTTLAYAAGIVDGEGCILVSDQLTRYKGKTPERLGQSYRSYSCRVAVATVDSVITPWLYQRFGGSLVDRGGVGRWTLATSEAERFLRLIFPFLKLKKSQAKIALRFCVMKRLAHNARNFRKPRASGSHATPESFTRQFARCKQLIRRERQLLKMAV